MTRIVWNRAPLAPNALAALPMGRIRARGWLYEQLRLSAAGLTGHMMELWEDVGPNSGWLGGSGESWERGPYYVRGLLALAHTLNHATLIGHVKPWIEWTLSSQRADGFFGPHDNDDWWPRMPMLEALCWFYDATGDARVVPFLGRYFRHQLEHLPARPLSDWGAPRGGDNLQSVLWLYNHTGDDYLLALAELLHQQTSDWIGELGAEGPPSEAFEFAHGVNRAMGFKEPALYSQLSRNRTHLAVVRNGWQRTRTHHGQIQGTFSSDEFLHGCGSTQGAEFCVIVELLSSLAAVLKVGGELWAADAFERLAYNALPAILSPDHRGHQYFEQPNQVACTRGPHQFQIHHDTDLLFGPVTGYGCCAANGHIGWPHVVNHLWYANTNGGLTAMLFAPCEVDAIVGGQPVTIVEDTTYPFGNEVRFTARCIQPVTFPLSLRVPNGTDDWTAELNGHRLDVDRQGDPGALITCARTWHDGDTLSITLRTSVRLSHWEHGAVGVERGPLVFALPIGEQWQKIGGTEPFADYEVYPTTAWNYALAIDHAAPSRSFQLQSGPMKTQPWMADGAGIALTGRGKRLPQWTLIHGDAGPIPETGLNPPTTLESLTLVPFGCARLRISMFPVVGDP